MDHAAEHTATRALVAAQDGDPDAFGRFVALTHADVTRYCTYLSSPCQAEDLVQDTYLRALRSLRTYRGDSPAHRWLLSIARRVCADAIHATDRARRPELTRRRHIDHTGRIELLTIIDELTDEHRQALVLTQVLGYSYDEAAAICECPVGTIRSRVARARARLADALSDADADATEHAS